MSVSIYEAKTRFSQLVAHVESTGEELVIRRHNVPVARLVPFRPVVPRRVLGGWEGLVEWEDGPLPADVAAAFAGEGS